MEGQNNDDMDSLFEGMVLFTPQTIDNREASSPSDVVPSVSDGSVAALQSEASPSSLPLDENLFSDLTVITPSHVEAFETTAQIQSSPMTTPSTVKIEPKAVPAVSMFRQSSRKKKRAGLRIGYGRDSQLMDDSEPLSNPPESISASENSLSASTTTIESESDAGGKKQEAFHYSSHASHRKPFDSYGNQHEEECVDGVSDDIEESRPEQLNKELNLTQHKNIAATSPEAIELHTTQKQEKEDEVTCDTVEGKYEQIKAQITEKLRQVRELATSISKEKKESRRRRRKAAENVELASVRYKEIENKLEEACETEDFEMAERLSESLAAAEKEKDNLLNALRDAEAHSDAIDAKMEEALECQIAAEEECVSMLQHFSTDTVNNANLVLETLEVNYSKDMDLWFMSVEAVEAKKLEIEIESQLVNDARSALNGSIEHLVEDDIKEKEVLCDKKKVLTQELEELLRLVREKEAEIAENDSKITAIDEKIDEVVSGFKDAQTGINANFDNLRIVLSEMESQSDALSKKKEDSDNLLAQGKNRVEELKKLARNSADEACMYEKNLRLRKSLVISVLKAREEKLRLAKIEENILADTQLLKQEISVARASLQELSSKKSSVQKEGTVLKQRMLFIDKRLPELEAEKKVAAAARNFKEAARIASEAKSLTAEKESQEIKLEEFMLELGKIDVEISETASKLQKFEELVSSKEKEAAVARFQRLRLTSATASNDRSAALELSDVEEASLLLVEAEAANSEAKELQSVHNISEEEFGNLSDSFIPMELLSSLDGKELEELAARCNRFPS